MTGWLVEYGTGAVTPQGRFVGAPFVVTAIDTSLMSDLRGTSRGVVLQRLPG